MGIIKEKKVRFDSISQSGEMNYKFTDLATRKPLLNSEGNIIDVFKDCSLAEVFPNSDNFKRYKIVYKDGEDLLIIKFKGYSVMSTFNAQKEGKVYPTLMWTDGNHGSYTSIPVMSVMEESLVKFWELKEKSTLPEPIEQAELLGDQ